MGSHDIRTCILWLETAADLAQMVLLQRQTKLKRSAVHLGYQLKHAAMPRCGADLLAANLDPNACLLAAVQGKRGETFSLTAKQVAQLQSGSSS